MMKPRTLVGAFAASALFVLAVPAAFADHVPGPEALPAASGNGATRVIAVNRSLPSVAVTRGETVTFVNGPKRFTWVFNDLDTSPVRLSGIAPADFGSGHLTVYVLPRQADVPGGS